MRFIKKFEAYVTGAVSINIDGQDRTFTIKNSDESGIFLMEDDEVYQRLDIETPDTKNLDSEEFYLSPEVSPEIVKELLAQGFIDKCNKETVAGSKIVKAYHLI